MMQTSQTVDPGPARLVFLRDIACAQPNAQTGVLTIPGARWPLTNVRVSGIVVQSDFGGMYLDDGTGTCLIREIPPYLGEFAAGQVVEVVGRVVAPSQQRGGPRFIRAAGVHRHEEPLHLTLRALEIIANAKEVAAFYAATDAGHAENGSFGHEGVPIAATHAAASLDGRTSPSRPADLDASSATPLTPHPAQPPATPGSAGSQTWLSQTLAQPLSELARALDSHIANLSAGVSKAVLLAAFPSATPSDLHEALEQVPASCFA